MAGECGKMPSQHECCKKAVASPQNAMATPVADSPALDSAIGATLAAAIPPVAVALTAAVAVYGPSPPLLGASTVLKI
jgi:hypothetical protein